MSTNSKVPNPRHPPYSISVAISTIGRRFCRATERVAQGGFSSSKWLRPSSGSPVSRATASVFRMGEKPKKAWSACPACLTDLGEGIRTSPPYDACPFCAALIEPPFWQRVVWGIATLVSAFGFPAWLGLNGWDIFFLGLVCVFPASVFAYIVVFRTMPPRYVRREESFTSLFHRRS